MRDEKTVILVAAVLIFIFAVLVFTGAFARMMQNRAIRIVLGIAAGYLILIEMMTDGGRQPMGWREWAIIILVTISWVSVTVSVFLTRKLVKCSPMYVQDLQERYQRLEENYLQLQRDLAAEQSKAEINSIYMQPILDKPTFSGAKIVDKTNGQLASADGLTREEKFRRAYALSVDGWSTAEIAKELKIAAGSVKVYISNGKKSYQRRGGDEGHYEMDQDTGMYSYSDLDPEDTSEAYHKRQGERQLKKAAGE